MVLAFLAVFYGCNSSPVCDNEQYQDFRKECHNYVVEEIGLLSDLDQPEELQEPICRAVQMLEICHKLTARLTGCYYQPEIRQEIDESVRTTKTWLRENKHVEC